MSNESVVRVILEEMRDILTSSGEANWANYLNSLVARLDSTPPNEVKLIAREALQMYGGMGSFTDLVLSHESQSFQEINNKFATLRSALYRELVNMITN